MPVESIDDSLLARLNALRPTTVSLSSDFRQHKSTCADPDESRLDNELAARFAKLGGGKQQRSEGAAAASEDVEVEQFIALQGADDGEGGSTVRNGEDDRTLQDLLSELNLSNEDTMFSRTEQQQAKDLARDAREAMQASKEPVSGIGDAMGNGVEARARQGEGLQDVKEEAEGEPQLSEEQEADEYISRILAEVDIEKQHDDPDEADGESGVGEAERKDTASSLPKTMDAEDCAPADEEDEEEEGDEHGLLPLPSAPTSLPATQSKDSEVGDLLPSTPSSIPSSETISSSKNPDLPTYTDTEIDTWCIICYANAEVRCLGCDGDLYCQNCWDEGHRGESAGMEERRHRAVTFVKGAKKTSRRKLAA